MTHLTILGKVDKEYVKGALLDLYLNWNVPKHVEEILIVDNINQYKVIEKRVPKKARAVFMETFKEDPTSMSLTYNHFDLIIISITQPGDQYLKHNRRALTGLLAHELMHVIQRRRNLDKKIQDDAMFIFDKFTPKLSKLNLQIEDVSRIFTEISKSANFTIKDLYDTFELFDTGMAAFTLEDYYNLYKTCSKPVFYHTLHDRNLVNIVKAICYEINLLSAIIPYTALARRGRGEVNKKARELIKHIDECYTVNISALHKEFKPLINYCLNNFSWKASFRRKYFQMIFEISLKLMMM